jgi:hypothetical protein
MIRERALMLRYTYIATLVVYTDCMMFSFRNKCLKDFSDTNSTLNMEFRIYCM